MKVRSMILWSVFILSILFCVFVLPFVLWNRMDSSPLNVWILDKTVPDKVATENKGLLWVLNSEKVISEENGQSREITEIPATDEKPDLIYLAGSAGVQKDDDSSTDNSDSLNGRFDGNEIASLKNHLGGGNTIIGEYGVADSSNKKGLADLFGISWTGWSCRHFTDLTKSIEVSDAIILNYEKNTGEDWKFEGGGYVLVSENDAVIVLMDQKDIEKNGLTLSFNAEYQDEFGVTACFPYDEWFELVKADPSTEMLASFNFDVTNSGKAKLAELGLTTSYSAITRSKNSQYSAYYFAGEFSRMNFSGNLYNYYGFSAFKRSLSGLNDNDQSKFYWGCYVPVIQKSITVMRTPVNKPEAVADSTGIRVSARTSGTSFQVQQNGEWVNFFSKGVNIGSTIPGKWFTEFTCREETYLKWFDQIGEMKANSIRVYTLMPPQFYSALVYYNQKHPDSILWLYQEIWPEENPEGDDYLKEAYNAAYQSEIRNDIDAMHGQITIPERSGRAYGSYTADVSPYIAGYLVGRELEPEEVISTNENHAGFTFNGNYLYTEAEASPTEAWLAMSCDYVLQYEEDQYQWQHPVGIVSWPTLDPAEHDSEWNEAGDKSLQYNDKVSVDINNISTKEKLVSGFFGAYHIYPNYPDFMNNEASYAAYTDEEGSFRYGGYLREFIAGQQKYPMLVAEFGLATGMGNAHENPDGYNHGGVTETAQGEGIVRMMKAMEKEGYAGGLIFEWADEWAKKTWITEPYILPFERNPLWHNAVDPEQNYGIEAMESDQPKSKLHEIEGNGDIEKMTVSADETYLNLVIKLKNNINFDKEKLLIGLDTYDRARGNLKFAEDISVNAATGLEYVIQINGRSDAQLLVQTGYNLTNGRYASDASSGGSFEKMSVLTNKEAITADGTKTDAIYQDLSSLNYGTLENNSYNHWNIEENTISIRIPWTRINVSDPSAMRVIDDTRVIQSPTTDELQTVITDGILASGVLVNKESNEPVASIGLSNTEAFTWETWNVPSYKERLKDSYTIIRDYFRDLDNE
ncbi:hypothetical protein GH808_00290 [Acetobacterium fimetarium]|uniref:Uncharacterized protein n=1 Tax=Acetobacterium fimetarium TaxID=52691 RepID=A0ABR6WQI3_9FIRM|nr:hypothetical protein [Acetobacterium fimetarium]MBC3802881.1 hypothetical protein [Acetobacterium fimetarium]